MAELAQGLDGLTDEERAEIEKLLEEMPDMSDLLDEAENPDLSAGAEIGADDGDGGSDDSTDAEFTDPNDDTGSGELEESRQPGNPPAYMCDVIPTAEMSGMLGFEVTNTLEAEYPSEECLFDVDGEAVASVQAYYGLVNTDPALYIEEQTADLWDYSDQLYGWGDAARYGSVSDGTYGAIAVAEHRSDSVVLLFMWMYGEPSESMLDTGATIAELVLPRI